MLALKEFANFISLNVANLATTYDRLLAENDEAYKTLPADARIASARRLIRAVAEACEAGTPDPFYHFFDNPNRNTHLLGGHKPPQSLLVIECLGQTLTPVVTNLEAGKFLWQILAKTRTQVIKEIESSSIPASLSFNLPKKEEADRYISEQFIQVQNKILLDLAGSEKLYRSDLQASLQEITKATAQMLKVQRVSIWFYNQDRSAIRCAKLYELNEDRYSDGFELEAVIYPAYFEALTTKQIITAHDAHTDPQTREFSKSYLTPLGINSMLDVPIQLEGRMLGVVCHEHIGPARQWAAQEQGFALSMAELVARVVGMHERKQAEEQLRKLSTAVEQSANTIVITDMDGYIQYVNRKFTETTGYTREEAIGQHTRLLKSGVTSAKEYKKLWETITAGGEWQGEFCNKKKNGEIYWEFASISPIKDEQGVITQFLAVKEEISWRKQAEQTLEQERNLLRTLIDNLPDFIYTKDSESRFMLANQSTVQSMGRTTPEELIGKTDFDFHPQILAAQYYADEQQLIRSGQPLLGKEEPVIDPAGNERWLSTTKVPLRDSQGAITGFVGISRDMTERKQLEQRIEESLERRTRQVQISTEIAQQISIAATLDDLFRRVVNLIQTQFDYYHVQVYTLIEGDLVLQEATGEAGQLMKEAGHRVVFTAEKSLVIRAVWSGEPVLVPDISQEPDWQLNPLLPETKAELAVPINLGAEVVGVLDVQNDMVGGLNEEDQLLLIGLCGQIAVAIDNRRVEAERRRADERLVEERNLLRAVIDNIPDLIYVKDTESRFLLVNAASVPSGDFTTPEDFVGKTDFDLNPPELAAQYYADEQTIIHSGQAVIGQEELKVTPPGQQRWFSTTKAPLQDGQGKIIGIIGVSRDITASKQTRVEIEQLLTEAERRAQREHLLREVSTHMAKSVNPETIIKIGLEALGQELSQPGITIQLTSETGSQVL